VGVVLFGFGNKNKSSHGPLKRKLHARIVLRKIVARYKGEEKSNLKMVSGATIATSTRTVVGRRLTANYFHHCGEAGPTLLGWPHAAWLAPRCLAGPTLLGWPQASGGGLVVYAESFIGALFRTRIGRFFPSSPRIVSLSSFFCRAFFPPHLLWWL
jgi:hypothetical protein